MKAPSTMPQSPTDAAKEVLDASARLYRRDPEIARELSDARRRLDEPLRVVLVGSVKAGKSTLINALLGEHLAPTDARECTKVVTWYRHGITPLVRAFRLAGDVVPLPLRRTNSRLELDLGDLEAESLERLEVTWPMSPLSELTLVDTPGTVSISRDVSGKTQQFIAPSDGVSGADAVVYLLRSLHTDDVEFLHALRAHTSQGSAALGAIAVLSRADELGGGRLDAMLSVNEAVARLKDDPALEGVCETVVPVAGLVALAGATLRQSEFASLMALEAKPREEMRKLLVSVDRFIATKDPDLPPPRIREELVERFGIYGIRLAIALIRGGARDAPSLSAELLRRSGLDELRRLVDVHFQQRHPELKARSAVLAARRILATNPREGSERVLAIADEHLSDQQAFHEMRLLARVRSAKLSLDSAQLIELERTLGGLGTTPSERLGIQSTTPALEDLRERAFEMLWKWSDMAENPLTDRETAAACRVAVRSCEGVIAELERSQY
jgi:hypothetical protein